MEMTGRPTQGSRGNQRENVVFGAFTCRSSRSLDKEEAIVSLCSGGDGGEREELTARAAVARGSASGAATVALHFDGWSGGGLWCGGGDVGVGSWKLFCGIACDDDDCDGMGWWKWGGDADTYTHRGGQLRTADGYVVPCLLHGEEDRKADSWAAARFVPGFHCVLFCVLCAGLWWRSSPTRCRTAPAWEASLTNGISSEAHDHPPGSVPSGWRCWTLNDSDGFRGHWWSDPAAGLAGQGGAMRHASPPTRAVCEICA